MAAPCRARRAARRRGLRAALALLALMALAAAGLADRPAALERQAGRRFAREELETQGFATTAEGAARSRTASSASSASSSAASSSAGEAVSWQRMGRFRVSDVSLLLPSEKALRLDADDLVPVSRVVSAKPGCFRWTSNDERVVTVAAETDDRCVQKFTSGSARIVSRHDSTNLTSTVVTAIQEDAATGEEFELNIEVYIAPIRGVRILTTVRRLNLYEAETLEVQAFDAEENVFSSLQGLAFDWTGVHATSAERRVPLEIAKLSNSDVSVTEELVQEHYGRFGHKIEVRGVKTGPARVAAELNYVGVGGHESRIVDEVVIDVVEAMGVCPPAPILIPTARLQAIAARKVSRSAWGLIDGTNDGHYRWRVEDTPAVEVADPEGLLVAREPGLGRLRFEESAYPTNGLSVPVRVVDPEVIELWYAPVERADQASKPSAPTRSNPCTWMSGSRFPLDARLPRARFWRANAAAKGGAVRWLMVVGRRYYVMATLGSHLLAEDQIIFVTPEMHFEFDKEASAQQTAEGGLSFLAANEMDAVFANSVRVVEATRAGFLDLSASFGAADLHVHQTEVQIVDPIELEKYIIRLPIDKLAGVMHSYRVRARGGTTQYTFSTPEANPVVDVDSAQGSLLVRQQQAANQSIVAQDLHDESNFAEAFVLVSEPTSLHFQVTELYVTIGDTFPLHAILHDIEDMPYDNCTGFETSLHWEVHGSAIASMSEGGADTGTARADAAVCSERMYRAISAGSATVTARYSANIRASLRIVVLNKISIESPKPDAALDVQGRPVALIMVHASVDMRVLGGKPGDNEVQVFSVELDDAVAPSSSRTRLELTDVPRREEDHVGIHRRHTGHPRAREFTLTCRREGDFEIVLERTATMVLLCRPAAGATITLMPDVAYDGVACGTGASGANMVTGIALPLRLDALDPEGRRFTHLQGFQNEWTLREAKTGVSFEALKGRTLADPMRDARVEPGFTGNVTVDGVLVFDDGESSHHASLAASFALGIYEDLALDPPEIWPIIPDPAIEYRMEVSHGPASGELDCSATSNAKLVVVSVSGRNVAVRFAAHQEPRDADAALLCQLKCLIGAQGLLAPIRFRRVAKVALTGPTKMREGAKGTLVMQAFSRENGPFSAEMHRALVPLLDPRPADALSLAREPEDAACVGTNKQDPRACAGEWRMAITAVKASEVLVRGSTLNGSVSADHKVRIYHGIEIVPGPEKAVEPGVRFRLRRRHGPFLDPRECHFEVSGQDASVAEILDEPQGLFYARAQGKAEVCVLCREDGHIIDQACVNVRVKELSEMEIQPSFVHIVEGDDMRLRGVFPEVKELPIDHGVIPREFAWSVENASVAAIQGPASSNEYSVWLSGLRPGKTRVTLRSASRKGHGALETSVIVIVEQKLRLLTPSQVIMPRMGALQIRTSVDALVAKTGGILSFFVGGRACHSITAESSNIIEVDVDGVITSKERLGDAPVIVEYRSVGSADQDIIQFATVHVLVREVASIGVRQLWPDLVVPLGMPREVHVAVFDKQGSIFTAPFNTLKVNALAVDDDILALKDAVATREGDSFHRLSLEGLQTGVSSVYLTLHSPVHETTREDYVRVVVIPGVDGVRFALDTAAPHNTPRPLLLVPGQPLLIPVQTMQHLNASQMLACEAQIGAQVLSTAMKVFNDSRAACQVQVPADGHDAEQDRVVLTLKVADQVISSQTVPFQYGFRLVPGDDAAPARQRTIAKGYLRWEEEEAIIVRLVGDHLDHLTVSSERPSLVTAYRDPRAADLVRLERQRNDTCGQSVHVIFESTMTGQVTSLVVFFACETSAWWWPLPTVLDLIQWQSIFVSTIVCLAVTCLLCGTSAAPFGRSRRHGHPIRFADADHPRDIPQTSRDLGLGAPHHYRR